MVAMNMKHTRPVRLGILGVGSFGQFCLEQYRRLPGVRITAICDILPEKSVRLAREYDIPFHTTDWRVLVTHPDVDVVYLATPPHVRVEPAIAAAEAGKHIFCEKPLALTLAGADAMLAAAHAHGVRLGINFVMRYSVLYRLLHKIIQSTIFGAPQRMLFENYAGDLPAGHWFWDLSRSGGVFVEHGVHFFDIFSWLFGTARLAWADAEPRATGEWDKWLAVVNYAPRAMSTFYHAFGSASALEQTRIQLQFTRGSIVLEGWIPERMMLHGLITDEEAAQLTALCPSVKCCPVSEQVVRADGREWRVSQQATGSMDAGEKQAIYAQTVRAAMRDFLAWTSGDIPAPAVTGVDARAALDLALQATAQAMVQK